MLLSYEDTTQQLRPWMLAQRTHMYKSLLYDREMMNNISHAGAAIALPDSTKALQGAFWHKTPWRPSHSAITHAYRPSGCTSAQALKKMNPSRLSLQHAAACCSRNMQLPRKATALPPSLTTQPQTPQLWPDQPGRVFQPTASSCKSKGKSNPCSGNISQSRHTSATASISVAPRM